VAESSERSDNGEQPVAPAVEVANLVKDVFSDFLRKRTRVLSGVNLTVNRGDTYGLLGPNGAGKTTTLKILLGLMRPTSGNVAILGAAPGDRATLHRIGYLPENPYFYSHLSGREFLDFIGQLFGLGRNARRAKADELLELVKMTAAADKPMRKYSKGMLQRLGIAQSLINDPEVVFWDEPMSGLDPIGRRDVREILLQLKRAGKTIFLNSHLLPDVHEVCDRIAIMHHGKLVCEESIARISATGNYRDLEDYFLAMVAADDEKSQARADDALSDRSSASSSIALAEEADSTKKDADDKP
jgi:ABC-2 type transport system ATP-binding protein